MATENGIRQGRKVGELVVRRVRTRELTSANLAGH